jgi:hypothetical protein
MECGFFCDTGAVIGVCDKQDTHYESCKFFFDKYPIVSYNYYLSETVKEELEHRKTKIARDALREYPQNLIFHSYIRAVQRCMDQYLKKMKSFDCKEYSASYKERLDELILELQMVIGYETPNQINDTEITANAIIWSIIKDYELSQLITVDKKDLCNKEEKIIKTCERSLKEKINLKMIYLPNYYYKKQLSSKL